MLVKIINKNKRLELIYKISAGIPFRWEYEIKDQDIVSFVKSKIIKDENKGALVGAPVYTKYIFKGLKEGETNIIFRCFNFADDYISSEDIYKVRVDSKKNISLISEKNKKVF